MIKQVSFDTTGCRDCIANYDSVYCKLLGRRFRDDENVPYDDFDAQFEAMYKLCPGKPLTEITDYAYNAS